MILTGPSTERILIQLLAENPCTNEPGARCPTWQAKAANFIGLQSIPVVFRIQAQPSIFCSSLLLLSSDHIFFIFPGVPQAIQRNASVAGGTVFASARGISWTGTCTATLNTSGSLRTDLSRSAKEVWQLQLKGIVKQNKPNIVCFCLCNNHVCVCVIVCSSSLILPLQSPSLLPALSCCFFAVKHVLDKSFDWVSKDSLCFVLPPIHKYTSAKECPVTQRRLEMMRWGKAQNSTPCSLCHC